MYIFMYIHNTRRGYATLWWLHMHTEIKNMRLIILYYIYLGGNRSNMMPFHMLQKRLT